MGNPVNPNEKALKGVAWIGILFLIVALYSGVRYPIAQAGYIEKNENYMAITAIIYNHGRDWRDVRYTVDNQEYVTRVLTSRNLIPVNEPPGTGSEIEIKYNPNDPRDIIIANYRYDRRYLFNAALFLIIGTYLTWLGLKRKKGKP
jgi:hypothetical protein